MLDAPDATRQQTRSRKRPRRAARLYTGSPLSRGEVAEWLKALAC